MVEESAKTAEDDMRVYLICNTCRRRIAACYTSMNTSVCYGKSGPCLVEDCLSKRKKKIMFVTSYIQNKCPICQLKEMKDAKDKSMS